MICSLRRLPLPAALLVVCAFAACSDSATEPTDQPTEDHIVEGVNLTELFAQPTATEINAVLSDWSTRDVSASNVRVELTERIWVLWTPFTLSIVSHTVGGLRHYGVILAPEGAGAGSLPVLAYLHGGLEGIDVGSLVPLMPILFGSLFDSFVLVAPSFRSEPLTYQGEVYLSEGPASPWDRDVDDALALLNVVLDGREPAADPQRMGVLGFSRGGGVGMLMAERDSRIDLAVEFYGPTDFFGPFVQGVTEEALRGGLPKLPGLDFLNDEYLQPLKRGHLTIADVRAQMLRRSPIHFAHRFRDLQIHHGKEDDIVPVGEAERLVEVMLGLGFKEPGFQYFIYEKGGHDPLTLSGSIQRTKDFVARLISPDPASR